MDRVKIDPRLDWQGEMKKLGYNWHTDRGTPYWTEDAYYHFTTADVAKLTTAAETVHKMYIDAGQYVIDKKQMPLIGIEPKIADQVEQWWNDDIPTLFGRFDFVYDGVGQPKLLEYNADTPGNMVETAIIQRNWREQRFPGNSQFNNLQSALTDRFREQLRGRTNTLMHVMADAGIPEDAENAAFVGFCAQAAGFQFTYINGPDIGVDKRTGIFYDLQSREMRFIYKQYPWDVWIRDDVERAKAGRDHYYPYVQSKTAWWLEPLWKLMFSGKGMLPMLWELNTEHPNLLPAYRSPSEFIGQSRPYVTKPIWGLQGRNIKITGKDGNIIAQTAGDSTGTGYIYQAYREMPVFDDFRPVVSVWIVTDKAVAISVREDKGLITVDHSRFVPHIVKD